MFLNFLKDVNNYEQRKVARIEPEVNNGIGVSTADTSDEGYETALLDKNGVHPVEKYKSREDAEIGHEKWVKFANNGNGKEINKLFWSDFGREPEKLILASV